MASQAASVKSGLKVVITGAGATGKSTLAMKLQDPDLDISTVEYIQTLLDPFDLDVVSDDVTTSLSVWDTAEDEEWSRGILLYYHQTDVFLLTYKVTKPCSLQNIVDKYATSTLHMSPDAVLILVGTHTDRRTDGQELEQYREELVSLEKVEEVVRSVGARAHVQVSAKCGTGLEELLQVVVREGLRVGSEAQKKERKNRKCLVL